MIKEGENIVLFKLRIKDELNSLALSNPELLDEYKETTIESIFNLGREGKISVKEARSAVEVVDPNYYGGQTFEEAEKETEAFMADLYAGIFTLGLMAVGVVCLFVWLVF